jgi:MFS superfamily sulfate permease-like transporter
VPVSRARDAKPGVIIAHVGGRPGIIFAVTGAMALVIGTLVKDHGFQYLLAATVLTGVLQILAGVLKLGLLMRFRRLLPLMRGPTISLRCRFA